MRHRNRIEGFTRFSFDFFFKRGERSGVDACQFSFEEDEDEDDDEEEEGDAGSAKDSSALCSLFEVRLQMET